MSVEVYSECRIQLRSNDGQMRNFDRCLIELRQYDIGDYALRTIDLNNNKSVRIYRRERNYVYLVLFLQEVFTLRLTNRNQYHFEPSVDQPDTLNGTNGTCQILLNPKSREIFHQVLRTCLEEFLIVKDNNDINPPSKENSEPKSKVFLDELASQENEPYYRNDEPFDCITCMDTIGKGEGILFYNCLHPFCKPCLLQMIQASTEPTIKCPHENCTMFLEEREMRGVRIQCIDGEFHSM